MINIKRFAFNPFQVNTYILWDETKECAIVDAGCYDEDEQSELAGFIEEKGLKPVRAVQTHCHIDHITGLGFMDRKYGLKAEAHIGGKRFIESSKETGAYYGFENLDVVYPEFTLKEGQPVRFGNSQLEVIETPGHADGSVCFISHADKFVITGDVLFYQSIGRTDFPTGDYDLLIKNIFEKLLTLPKDYTVYPGHGQESTIGYEAYSNPFLTGQ